MSELEQQATLARTRAIATGLLVLMAVVFVVARATEWRHPAIGFVAAFAEAAMVGALADWFAVTALFRHPFGLPIPHTAIIPRNKARIARSIGHFLEHNFMTREVLSEEMRELDFAGMAAGWLKERDNRRAVATQAVALVPALVRAVEDEDISRFLQRALGASLSRMRLGPVAAELLEVLIAGGRHHAIFDRLLETAGVALERHKPYIRQKVHEQSPRWMPRAIDERFYVRIVDGMQNVLDEMRDPSSGWRERFEVSIRDWAARLRDAPDVEEALSRGLEQALGHPLLRDYLGQVWGDVRERLLADAAAPDSGMASLLENALEDMGAALAGDEELRIKLNTALRSFAVDAASARRHAIAGLVQRVIDQWDTDTVTRKFELQVGRDLQYIRINGTLVGGLVGLVLHAVTLTL